MDPGIIETQDARWSGDLGGFNPEKKRKSNVELIKKTIKKAVDERLTADQIFSRYVDLSTFHGVKYACTNTVVIRRCFWSCFMLYGAVYFFDKLKLGIEEYRTYPFSTLSTVDYVEHLTFPAISFCLINSYNISRVKESEFRELLHEMDFLHVDENWKKNIVDIPGKNLEKILRNVSIKIDDVFVNCEWINRDTRDPNVKANVCGSFNFSEYFNEQNQLCFTLNSGKFGHEELSVNHSGLSYAYNLLFDLRLMESLQHHPYGGLKVVLHEQNQPPTASDGFMLSPGFTTYVKMSKTEKKHLPPPYSTRCGHKAMRYHLEYSQKACLLEILTDDAAERCNCRAPFMPDNGLRFCSLNETVSCILPVKEAFNETEKREKCPIECQEISYNAQLTTGRYVPISQHSLEEVFNDYIAPNISEKEYTRLEELIDYLSPQELERYIKNNFINVYFFYGEMTKEIHEQEGTLDFYQFLGDMGGEIGLMMGASILSFFEVVDLALFLSYNLLLGFHKKDDKSEELKHRRKSSIERSSDEEEYELLEGKRGRSVPQVDLKHFKKLYHGEESTSYAQVDSECLHGKGMERESTL